MAIAACYVTSEGVVLGADSTVTVRQGSAIRHYNHAQKLFEIGDAGSTLGFVAWGLGALRQCSYRTMLACLSDDLIQKPPQSVEDAARRWTGRFWQTYSADFSYEMQAQPALGPEIASNAR